MFKRLFSLTLIECFRQSAKFAISAMLMTITVFALSTTLNIDFSINETINSYKVGTSDTKTVAVLPNQKQTAGSEKHSLSASEINIYRNIIKLIKLLIYIILAFIAFVLYISTTSIMMDNKNQLSLYKIIGFDNIKIIQIVISEVLLISLSGFILAIPLTYFVDKYILSSIIKSYHLFDFNIYDKPLSEIVSLGIVFISVIFVTAILYLKIRKVYPSSLLKED